VADIFISYAREDSDIARRLSYLFELEDWTCWWDPKIAVGQDFRPIVSTEIDAAKVVVVVWSPAARSSSWVRFEVDRARALGTLAELQLDAASAGGRRSDAGALVISTHPHMPPTRDQVLERVAVIGGLRRRSDGWNSTVTVTGWRGRPPKRPVIGWEWIEPGRPSRLIRRERWVGSPTVSFRTAIGNAWMFGYENEVASIGHLFITESEHRIQLPKPDRRAERRAKADFGWRFVPFNVDVRITEFLSDIFYPADGPDLG
jgi:hypothetical protein